MITLYFSAHTNSVTTGFVILTIHKLSSSYGKGSCTAMAGHTGSGDAGSDPKRRPTDPAFAPTSETAFSDGFPYLCCSEVCTMQHMHAGTREENDAFMTMLQTRSLTRS